jgi:hypothetical protein
MLYQSDEVVLAQIHERRSSLLAEAAARRLARHSQPPVPSRTDRLLAVLGARMVQWGDRLQARSRQPHTPLPGSYTLERV